MGNLMSGLIHIYAFTAAVPFLWFFIIWLSAYWWRKDSKFATKLAMDVTTLLLIGCVSGLFKSIFGGSFGFYLILLFFLIGYGLIGNFQRRVKGTLNHRRIFRMLWRVGFLVLSAIYFLFVVIGLIKSIVSV